MAVAVAGAGGAVRVVVGSLGLEVGEEGVFLLDFCFSFSCFSLKERAFFFCFFEKPVFRSFFLPSWFGGGGFERPGEVRYGFEWIW